MRGPLQSWAREEEASLRKLAFEKTTDQRLDGFVRSRRNEAKLFLTAIVPVLLVGLFVPKWADASAAERFFMTAAGVWFAGTVLIGGFFIFRTLVRASKKQDG